MNTGTVEANVQIDVVRLDSEIIDEHLRSSTAVLQDILKDENKLDFGELGCRCIQCGKLYKTPGLLNMHQLLKHPVENVKVKCTQCGKTYPSLLSLQKHVRYMHLYNHRCKACYRTFSTAFLLRKHENGCSQKKTPCDTCGKIFDSTLALRNHNKYKHPESLNNSCEICRRTFMSGRSLSNHMAAIHLKDATQCRLCHVSFNSPQALQSHILYKHNTDGVMCILCSKLLKSNNGLVLHLHKIHFAVKNYSCRICNIDFNGSKSIVQHMMTVHTNKK